jgi:hypothetical protein
LTQCVCSSCYMWKSLFRKEQKIAEPNRSPGWEMQQASIHYRLSMLTAGGQRKNESASLCYLQGRQNELFAFMNEFALELQGLHRPGNADTMGADQET